MKIRGFISKAILVLLPVASGSTAWADAAKPNDLPRSDPEAQGVRSSAIQAFVEAAEEKIDAVHSLMLLRHGKVVAEGWWTPYGKDDPHVLYSLSKSFTSTAVGMAIAEGKLTLDDSVLAAFPEDAPAQPSDNLKAMRLRDLLRMNTGQHAEDVSAFHFDSDDKLTRVFLSLPVAHKPGTHFWYNTPATYMASAMVQKATGQTVLDYLRPRLFEPLGIENPTWDASKQGIIARRLRAARKDRGHRALRPALPAEGRVAGQAAALGRVDRRGHRAPDLERQQPDERLGAGLRLPVLALPPRALPRRRRLRPVLHRHGEAGRRRGDHERHARPRGRHEPGLGAHPAGAAARSAAGGRGGRDGAAPQARRARAQGSRRATSRSRSPRRCRASATCFRRTTPSWSRSAGVRSGRRRARGAPGRARRAASRAAAPGGAATSCSRTASPRRSPAAAPGPRTTPTPPSSPPTRRRSS